MENINIQLNSNIISGDYSFDEIVDNLGFEKLGIVCDQKLCESSTRVKNIIEVLQERYDPYLIMYDHKFEPSYQYLDRLMAVIRAKEIDTKLDAWIGIGGGSSMDTAKGLAILCRNSGPSIQYKGFPSHINEPLPVIAVPSTTGSGSEVAFNASFIDEDSKTKMGINYYKNYPVASILDPEIVSSAPRSVLASSGCDALVHSLEGFVSKSANHVSRTLSARAFHIILKTLPILLKNEGGLTHWSDMQWAAVFAMWGLANSSSGPAGAMSYYLGTHYEIPHGVAGAVFIGKISDLNHEHGFHDYADLYGWSPDQDFDLGREERSEFVVEEIQKLLVDAGTPKTLSDCGVPPDNYCEFYEFADQVEAVFELNPVKFSATDLNKLLT